MKRINTTYKYTAILLLTIILSHLFLFHFELEEKVLCVGDGDHFHVESIANSHLKMGVDLLTSNYDVLLSTNYNCTDYHLDNHVDEDYAKNNRVKIIRSKKFTTINSDIHLTQQILRNISKNIYTNQLFSIRQLNTVRLLI